MVEIDIFKAVSTLDGCNSVTVGDILVLIKDSELAFNSTSFPRQNRGSATHRLKAGIDYPNTGINFLPKINACFDFGRL